MGYLEGSKAARSLTSSWQLGLYNHKEQEGTFREVT